MVGRLRILSALYSGRHLSKGRPELHVAIAWNVQAEGPRQRAITDRLKEAIQGFSWARPLPSFYIVRIESAEDRDRLQERLLAVVKDVPEKVHFVVSPPMSGGKYNGWLPKDMWPKI